MSEVGIKEQLRLEFERQSVDKCIEVALRAAIRNFIPPNFEGNAEASESYIFPFGRLLLQAIVHSRHPCSATKEALNRTLSHLAIRSRLLEESSAFLTAIAALNRDKVRAIEVIENVSTSFASGADREQVLLAQTLRDYSTRHAYDSAYTVVLNTSLSDLSIPDENVFDHPLWSDTVTFKVPLDQRANFRDYFLGQSFAFWRAWHQGFVEGRPLDWELQRRVALIDETIWNAGPKAVSDEIEQIRARWEVEKALSDIKGSLTVRTSARHGIGGNNPPESIDDERLSGAITLIWEATEELSTALEEERPARAWIEAILGKLKAGLAGFLKWCAGKGDLAVDTLIKWGIPATGAGYAAKYPEKIEALIKAIEDWLPYLH